MKEKITTPQEWEASTDLSQLQSEEQVQIPRSVLNLLLLHFESGLTRHEQLEIASCTKNPSHLAAIKLCYDRS